jgi:hypothetical protein
MWQAALGDTVELSAKEARALGGTKGYLYVRDPRGLHPAFDAETGKLHGDALAHAVNNGHEIIQVDPRKLQTLHSLFRGGQTARGFTPGDLAVPSKLESQQNLLQRTHRTWKWWATAPNPSYHLRNLAGDTFNAVLAGTQTGDFATAFRLNRANSALKHVEASVNTPEGRRAIAALTKAQNKVEHFPHGDLTHLEIIGLANKYGAINTGIVSGELREAQRLGKGVADITHTRAAGNAIQAVGDYRENLVRLATFRNGLKRGMTPSEAAQYSLRHHIDYANLSKAERDVWRYVFPFWTWWSRNLPLQLTKMATKPGIYANVEKARRQSLGAAGVDPNISAAMQNYEQENLPWGTPFKISGTPVTAAPGLPYMDVGSVPYLPAFAKGNTSAALQPIAQDLFSRVNPFVKTPAEVISGINAFTLQPHEQYGEGKYVPAPSWLPNDFPGVKRIYDKKSGKMVKGVNWRVMAGLGLFPVAQRAGRLSTPESRPGKPTPAMVGLGWAAGPRFAPAPVKGKEGLQARGQLALNQLYDMRSRIDGWISEHKPEVPHQTGVPWSKTPGGGEIAKAYEQRAKIDAAINNVRRTMGYKNVKKVGRPRSKKIGYGAGGGSPSTIVGGSKP